MAGILIVLWKIRGRNRAALTLGRRLADAGHAVTVASTEDLEPLTREAGLPFRRWPVPVPPPKPWRRPDSGVFRDLGHGLRNLTSRRAAGVDERAVAQVQGELRALAPDSVLCDVELPEFILLATAAGFPVAQLHRAPDLTRHGNVPPIHTPLVPAPVGDASAFRIRRAWARYHVTNFLQRLRKKGRFLGADRAAALARLARGIGYDLKRHTTRREWMRPFAFRDVPVLLMQLREFDFPRPPRPDCHHLGTLVDPERERGLAPEARAALERFLEPDGPVVACAFGAYYPHDDRDMFRRVVEVARARPGLRFVVGAGGRFEAEAFGDLPANVLAMRWIPQLRVLSRARAAIVHGGASSIMECVHFGVPMVVLPFDMNDQQGNAARVAYHRLGRVCQRDRATPEVIRQCLDQALDDDALRRRCAAFAAVARRYETEGRAVRAVEALLLPVASKEYS